MLSGSSSTTVISLTSSESSEEEAPDETLHTRRTPPDTRKNQRKLELKISEVSISSTSSMSNERIWKSCAQKSLEFMFTVDIHSYLGMLMSDADLKLWEELKSLSVTLPSVTKVLGVLLSRQWPKWQAVRIDDEVAFEALIQFGAISSLDSVNDWTACLPNAFPLYTEHALMNDLKPPSKSADLLDSLMESLPVSQLRALHNNDTSSISRSALKTKIRAAYNGTQRTIFGSRNDVHSLIKKVKSVCESGSMKLILLNADIRRFFAWMSFALDIDSDDENSWNYALPSTLLKSYADKNIGGVLSPRQLAGRIQLVGNVPGHLRIWQSRDHIETCRLLAYLQARVESRKFCARTVASNVRQFVTTVDLEWNRNTHPEWWWRRQIPRRCSNILWKCIAELERIKQYDVCVDHLEYLLEHGDVLLGRKRRGKVAIRYLIELRHVGRDVSEAGQRILETCDLFPADRAEIERRISGFSIHKFGWPCGEVAAVSIMIPGAKNRDFNWVEQAALDHHYCLPENGYSGAHCEGRIMMELFRIFFASVLVPRDLQLDSALIQSPIQRWALDVGFLSTESERWTEVDEILKEIHARDFSDLADFFLRLQVTESDYDLAEIVGCLRGSVLAHIMRLMMTDPFYWGGGQPDLLVWSVEKRDIIFAEVKGPGDQLSPRQRWWLTELTNAGARAEVCYVTDEKPEKIPKKFRKRQKNIDIVNLE